MLRDLRAADTPRLIDLLRLGFPEEESLLGTRPDGVERVARRVFRWDARFVLGVLRALGRPPFRFFVVEAGGRIVATTLLSFPEGAGFVSMVVVDPTQRRRGLARRLLAEARRATARRGRPHVVLDVLESNAPARALYESIGYRPLRATGYFVRPAAAPSPPAVPPDPGRRPFVRADAEPLAAIAQRSAPPDVARILPVRPRDLIGSNWVAELLETVSAAWVIDRGAGPEAYVSASRSPATEAGHLSAPIVAETADPAAVVGLVRAAVDWLSAHGAPRAVAMVPEANGRARAALEEAGFRRALSILTLQQPSA